MNISIFGLGYVGVVSAGCLASRGHRIVGVDVNEVKVNMLNDGVSPIVEKDLPELLSKAKENGMLHATTEVSEAIAETELSIICVGTPSRSNGCLDTSYIESVCQQIGTSLKDKDKPQILVFRSTMLPGTMREVVIPMLEEASGKKQNKDFYVAFNPEFLRESTAVYDFNNPPKTVVGADSDEAAEAVLGIYEGIPGPRVKTKLEVAEMVKYVDNNFHALKITFANEIGTLCKSVGLDSHEVMNIFLQDMKLNISPVYLKPGFAFGGSCLPKDLRAISCMAKLHDVETPMLNSIMQSNNLQIQNAVKKIISYGKKKIGVAGFSFKAGTDDLRESPIIELIETLLGKGYDLKLYDKNVYIAKLIGANKEYINERIPHVSTLMVDSLDDLLNDREVIVIGNKDKEFERLLTDSKEDQKVYDLVRIGEVSDARDNYEGISW
ncbi:MAG: nucleotide sugar dehydrogenase [Bacillota bacterium]